MGSSASSNRRSTSTEIIDRRVGAAGDAIVATEGAEVDRRTSINVRQERIDPLVVREAVEGMDSAVEAALGFGGHSLDFGSDVVEQAFRYPFDFAEKAIAGVADTAEYTIGQTQHFLRAADSDQIKLNRDHNRTLMIIAVAAVFGVAVAAGGVKIR